MAKCPVCGGKMGFGNKMKVKDGCVCAGCARISSMCSAMSIQELENYWSKNHARFSIFTTSGVIKQFGTNHVNIDNDHRLFYFGNLKKLDHEPIVYAFDEVLGYRIRSIEGATVTKSKGGLGRAAVGGALFGPAGAVIGASTAKTETKTVGGDSWFEIDFATDGGRTTAIVDNRPVGLEEFLDSCMDDSKKNTPTAAAPSDAEELMKWKILLDRGAITEEEYSAKKKQLLGL